MSNEFDNNNINSTNDEIRKDLDIVPETRKDSEDIKVQNHLQNEEQNEEQYDIQKNNQKDNQVEATHEAIQQVHDDGPKGSALDKREDEKLLYTFWAESEEFIQQDNLSDNNDVDNNKELSFTEEISEKLKEHMKEQGLNDYNDTFHSENIDMDGMSLSKEDCSIDVPSNQDELSFVNKSDSCYGQKYEDLLSNHEIDEEYRNRNNSVVEKMDVSSEENVLREGKKSKLAKKIASFVATAAAFGLIAGLTFNGVNYLGNKLNKDESASVSSNAKIEVSNGDSNKEQKIATTSISNGAVSGANDVSDLVISAMPSIVSINCSVSETVSDFFGNTYDKEGEGSGSGIIVGKNDTELLIVTNNHVVQGAKKIVIKFVDNKEVEAVVKGKDSTADLAVVAIKLADIKEDTLNKIKVAVLGDSDKVKVGQMAVAIGNALGYGQSVTVGYISAKDRTVEVAANQRMVLLQTDAAINPGNSGGALLNANGEVIGINSAKTAANEVEGMGYAIPISKATPIINDLMNREILSEDEQGYLGITGADITDTDIEKFNLPAGVSIADVVEDGPADKAGLKRGDIITKINDTEVNTFSQLKEKVNSNKIGTELTITYMRSDDGEYKENVVKVVLAKRPEQSELTGETTLPDSGSQPSDGNGSVEIPEDGSEDGLGDLDEFFNFGN